jgi:signal peptidase I
LELLIALVIGWLLVDTWQVEGIVVPVLVPSGSMAETLLGVHRDLVCEDCGFRFACGSDFPPLTGGSVCPNCGHRGADLAGEPDVEGDRVLIDKSTFRVRPPRPWEVVAFRHPGRASLICVKRVVGLPGETIEICHGDVYVDGRIRRKTLAEQRAVAVLVHDASYLPKPARALLPRWQCSRPDSRWFVVQSRFGYPSQADNSPVDWCVYHHLQRPYGDGVVRETPVRDECSYNQARPRRGSEMHDVPDLLLSLRLDRTSGRGRLLIRAGDGRREFIVRLEPALGRYEVLCDGELLRKCCGEISPLRTAEPWQIEVSLFDRQFLLAIDGQTLAVQTYEYLGGQVPQPSAQPLAIGSDGLGLEISEVRVYRDVYYTDVVGAAAHWGVGRLVRLGSDEYFVLGDNSPISDDSRTWPGGPAVPDKLLFGRPFLVHFPARQVSLWGRSVQLPDLSRIRYIH